MVILAFFVDLDPQTKIWFEEIKPSCKFDENNSEFVKTRFVKPSDEPIISWWFKYYCTENIPPCKKYLQCKFIIYWHCHDSNLSTWYRNIYVRGEGKNIIQTRLELNSVRDWGWNKKQETWAKGPFLYYVSIFLDFFWLTQTTLLQHK